MDGKPDLIIGNYTDGNLVASLMANKLRITQVTTLLLKFSYSVTFVAVRISFFAA